MRLQRFATALLALVVVACGDANQADTLYVGENILTMNDEQPRVTALAVRDGKIIGAGTQEALSVHRGHGTRVVELGDKALLPGFIDAHGHVAVQAFYIRNINVAPPPVGPVETFADIQDIIKKELATRKLKPGEWLVGNGYDDALLAEHQHPDRKVLDAVSPDNPVVLFHVSGHMMVLNSKALETAGIDESTIAPEGGEIKRYEGTLVPTGLLTELARDLVIDAIPRGGILNSLGLLKETQALFASNGYTTLQEGYMMPVIAKWFKLATLTRSLKLDVVAYPGYMDFEKEDFYAFKFGRYKKRLKFGGAKLILDGSIQGKTGYLSQPYLIPPEGKDADYRGFPQIEQQDLEDAVRALYRDGIPLIAHANGDAAAEQIIVAAEKAYAEFPGDHRTVMIHAQTVRDDQMDRMKTIGMIPSFFSAHPFFWGDWHKNSVLGEERAYKISPTASAIERDMIFTIHNDAPVVPPDVMRLIWSTVTRQSRSGKVIGPDERISVMEALKATTISAAYQIFEEDTKGSLEVGKFADLVILGENPISADLDHLKYIEVIETIFRGKTVYRQ
jgi:predicted amidohydrolase YtcJ